jgi:lipopolysaccharide/colanic/teichoic acid biosynthesis glycosyltransferase
MTIIITLLVAQREVVNALSGKQATQAASAAFWFPAEASLVEIHTQHCELPYSDNSADHLLKRMVDVGVALVVLILTAPLFVCVAVLIRLDSSGPVLIRQRRVGRCGVVFSMWKFRTMQPDVCRYAPSPISDADPRLTRLGRALRRFSIDELPQLANVLWGDMSLVGPRPEMPFIVQTYGPRERLRLEVTPGITGLWQISPARAMPIHQNLELDLFYIRNRNFFLDLAILLRTVTAVFRGIGAT